MLSRLKPNWHHLFTVIYINGLNHQACSNYKKMNQILNKPLDKLLNLWGRAFMLKLYVN